MSRILALDFGDKRIGAAISDESQSIALPLCCIDASNINESISRIKEICQRKNIKTIVLGLPLTLKGEKGIQVLKAEKFAQTLKKTIKASVIFEDERLTTKEAEKILRQKNKRKKEDVDIISAILILRQYLEKR